MIRDHARSPLYLTQPRVWLLPAIALLGMVLVTVTGTNERVFIFLNKLGPAIGDPLWADLTILGDTAVAMALCLVLARRRPDLLWAALPSNTPTQLHLLSKGVEGLRDGEIPREGD